MTIVTDIASEPVTVAEFKNYARIDYTTDDVLIETLISSARRQVEAFCGVGLGVRTLQHTMVLDGTHAKEIPIRPLISVTAITYQSCRLSDVENIFATTDEWKIDVDGDVSSLYGDKGKYVITFTAGLETVTEDLKTAVMSQAFALYENRGADGRLTPAAKELCKSYRRNVWAL